jgi:moderate conductance mechanosensitive channel
MRAYISMVWAAGVTLAAVVAGAYLLRRFGIAESRLDPRQLADWLLTRGVKSVVIIFAALAVIRAASLAIEAMSRVGSGAAHRDLEWQRRAQTLTGILRRLVTAVVWFVAILMLLRELTIDVLPLLTGAGIAGLAIGFGAQNLVRDVISGFFLILEDQIRVGDTARINNVSGSVEAVNLRTIVLRDGEGAVHVFPAGTVNALANLSKGFAFATVDVQVSHGENLDRVFGTIREVGRAMQTEPALAPLILAPIEVVGIEALTETLATIKCKFKTLPLNNAKVANELRRRLLGALQGRGIKPYAR